MKLFKRKNKLLKDYVIVTEYEKIKKEFVEKFLKLMSDDMYITKPSNQLRELMLMTKLQELKNEIEKEYVKQYLGGRYEEYYRD
jgi:hypothetical protein